MARFWSGPRSPGRASAVAEQQVWPAPRRPLLTYVLPLGQPRADGPHLEGAAPGATVQSRESSTTATPAITTGFTSVNTEPNMGERDAISRAALAPSAPAPCGPA